MPTVVAYFSSREKALKARDILAAYGLTDVVINDIPDADSRLRPSEVVAVESTVLSASDPSRRGGEVDEVTFTLSVTCSHANESTTRHLLEEMGGFLAN